MKDGWILISDKWDLKMPQKFFHKGNQGLKNKQGREKRLGGKRSEKSGSAKKKRRGL